mgnify:CR=1 FL=1
MAYTTIDNPELYFQAKEYSGSSSDVTVTFDGDENMQPDWVWLKSKASGDHLAYDSVRGVNMRLQPNATDAEVDRSSNNDELKSFNSDGWTLGTFNSNVTGAGNSCVSWNWKAGGSASSNSNGSITSSVSANTTAGFSIVAYTGNETAGATVGHGLGAVPQTYWVKSRSVADGWRIYHDKVSSDPETDYLILNATNANADSHGYWNDTAPTSSVFSLGAAGEVNTNSSTNIAYCFAEKQGFSKFGSFVGNSNTNGTFIYTGFRPSLVIAKVASDTNDWFMFDNKRSSFNAVDDSLFPNKSDAESTSHVIDFLSNGFKIRDSDGTVNSTGNTYIYMAFAEAPFVNSNGVPCNAR